MGFKTEDMKKLLLISLLLCTLTPLRAQEDSVLVVQRHKNPYYQPKQLIAPAVLIAVGSLGLVEKSPVDLVAQKAFKDMNPDGNTTSVDEYLQYVPSVVEPFLGFIPGVKAKHPFWDRVIASATAHALMAALTNTVKYTVRERRPDSDARNSFFSGHTATAFTGAELTRIEYGWGYGAVAYAAATSVAFMRVYNKRHWVGDVIAGAGAGILCANAGYWMLPVWKRWFGKKNATETTLLEERPQPSHPIIVAAPFYDGEYRAAGIACNIVF